VYAIHITICYTYYNKKVCWKSQKISAIAKTLKKADIFIKWDSMASQKRGGGKSRKITDKVKADLIEGMAAGHTLLDMCDKHGLDRSGVWRARQADAAFDEQFERAACNGISVFLETAKRDLATATTRDEVLKYKELLRHAEWMAEKRLAIFQPAQRAEITHSGPMVVGWQTIEGKAETIFSADQVTNRARQITTDNALPDLTTS
jgi:hypothetical protein